MFFLLQIIMPLFGPNVTLQLSTLFVKQPQHNTDQSKQFSLFYLNRQGNMIKRVHLQGWLRCLILTASSDSSTADLQEFTNYVITLPELDSLFTETDVKLDINSDYFETFLISLERKHSLTQVRRYISVTRKQTLTSVFCTGLSFENETFKSSFRLLFQYRQMAQPRFKGSQISGNGDARLPQPGPNDFQSSLPPIY